MEKKGRKIRYGLPLPEVCHLELSEEQLGDRAVFVIGDVHGCYDELEELMDKAKQKEKNILFIFVGDFVSKGPKIKEVIKRIREDDCLTVAGNHELNVLREVRSLKEDPEFELRERYQWIRTLTEDEINFMKSLPFSISIPHLKVHIVHAGLVPGIPLQEQCLVAMTNVRNLYHDGDELKPTNKYEKGEPWATFWTGPEHVYFGHDEKRGLQQLEFATGLDTGCSSGEYLTGIFVNGCKEVLNTKAHKVYL